MTNAIVFEGVDEVIVVAAGNVNAIIKEWFLEGERSLDDYNVYLTDISKGFVITTGVKFDDGEQKDFDVTELMPNALRGALVVADLLTEE